MEEVSEVSLFPGLRLFETSIIAKYCSASTKLSILSGLNSAWYKFLFSGYAWTSFLDSSKDETWLEDISLEPNTPFGMLSRLHNSDIVAQLLKKFSHFQGLESLPLTLTTLS